MAPFTHNHQRLRCLARKRLQDCAAGGIWSARLDDLLLAAGGGGERKGGQGEATRQQHGGHPKTQFLLPPRARTAPQRALNFGCQRLMAWTGGVPGSVSGGAGRAAGL